MSNPNHGEFLFEQDYCAQKWRVQVSTYQGKTKANIMPWWTNGDGILCPPKRDRALHMPIEQLYAMADAINAYRAANQPDKA